MKRLSYFLFLFLILSFCVGCSRQQTTDIEKDVLVFMAGYKPQASLPFVGVYVAEQMGFYDEENLEVKILHTAGSGEHLQLLAAGKVDVTTQDAAILLQRRSEPGLPLVSIALIGQKGQQAYVALQESGIESPEQWAGHSIGYRGTPPPDLFAMLHSFNLDEDVVKLINVGFDLRIFTEKKVDIYPVFKSNEPFMLDSWGFNYHLWDSADYGIPSMGLCFVTSDTILDTKLNELTRFLRATIKGIYFAQENSEVALESVMRYSGPETDIELMRFMLESEILDSVSNISKQYGLGWQTYDQWKKLADLLVDYDIMKPVDISSVFTTKVLKDAQGMH